MIAEINSAYQPALVVLDGIEASQRVVLIAAIK
jgi:uncharacterized protein (DUF362 family)